MSGFSPPPPVNPPSSSKSKVVPLWAWISGGIALVVVSVLVALIFTVGKGNTQESTPSPTVTVTEAPTPSRTTGPTSNAAPQNIQTKEGFSNLLRDMFPVLNGYSDREITERAERTCDLFDDGASFIEVIEISIEDARSPEEAEAFGGISGAGVSVLCPEHNGKIEPYL